MGGGGGKVSFLKFKMNPTNKFDERENWDFNYTKCVCEGGWLLTLCFFHETKRIIEKFHLNDYVV